MQYNPIYFSAPHARALGYKGILVHPMFVFATALGLSVEDLSEAGGPFLGVEDLTEPRLGPLERANGHDHDERAGGGGGHAAILSTGGARVTRPPPPASSRGRPSGSRWAAVRPGDARSRRSRERGAASTSHPP